MAQSTRIRGTGESVGGRNRRRAADKRRKEKSDAFIKRSNAARLKPTKSEERQQKLKAMKNRQILQAQRRTKKKG